MRYGESFHPSLLAFLFDWWMKRREIAEGVSMNCTAFTYYATLMAKRTCAWLHHPLKLLPSALLSCTDSSHQDSLMLRLICMFLGCDMPIQLVLSSEYDNYDRLEDQFIMYRFMSQTTKYVTFYAWINRLTRSSTCNPRITAASLC